MELIDRLILTMDNNETPLNIYLDMSKAFDTIDHTILINKLTFYGIHGVTLDLIKSYLNNRYQFVEYDGVQSTMLPISTRVPQGSILGPLLFIIYINDFPNASRLFNFIMYADDTTLSCTIPRNSSKSQAYLALTEQEQSEPVDKEQSRITRPRRHALKHRCS